MIRLIIPSIPVAKGRPRLSKWGTYTPKKTKDYEAYVQSLWAQQYGNMEPSQKPIKCDLTFEFEPPKSYTKTMRKRCLQEIWHVKKPDTDNLIKSVTDSLNGLAYVDDSQIVVMTVEKKYGEESRTVIELFEL